MEVYWTLQAQCCNLKSVRLPITDANEVIQNLTPIFSNQESGFHKSRACALFVVPEELFPCLRLGSPRSHENPLLAIRGRLVLPPHGGSFVVAPRNFQLQCLTNVVVHGTHHCDISAVRLWWGVRRLDSHVPHKLAAEGG